MANVRDSDTSLWLHNKLGTSNDSWTSGSISSQLNKEVLRNIKDCFPDLQTQVKLKLLLSFFHIPRRHVEEWKTELEEIIDTAGIDSELWVSMLAETMKTFPATGSLNTEIADYEETRPIFTDMVNDLKKMVTKHSDIGMLPLECQYLNKPALIAMVGQQQTPIKHFTLKRKPKSTSLRAELLQKSCDAQSTLKKVSAPTIPLRSRGMPRKMTDTTPLKGIPSRVPTSGFRSPPTQSQNRPNFSRLTAGRKDGGIKLLEITEQPLGYAAAKKRKRQQELEEQQKKVLETQNNNNSPTTTTPTLLSTSTPDYAAGLSATSVYTQPPTPSAAAATPIKIERPASPTPIIVKSDPNLASTTTPALVSTISVSNDMKPPLINIASSSVTTTTSTTIVRAPSITPSIPVITSTPIPSSLPMTVPSYAQGQISSQGASTSTNIQTIPTKVIISQSSVPNVFTQSTPITIKQEHYANAKTENFTTIKQENYTTIKQEHPHPTNQILITTSKPQIITSLVNNPTTIIKPTQSQSQFGLQTVISSTGGSVNNIIQIPRQTTIKQIPNKQVIQQHQQQPTLTQQHQHHLATSKIVQIKTQPTIMVSSSNNMASHQNIPPLIPTQPQSTNKINIQNIQNFNIPLNKLKLENSTPTNIIRMANPQQTTIQQISAPSLAPTSQQNIHQTNQQNIGQLVMSQGGNMKGKTIILTNPNHLGQKGVIIRSVGPSGNTVYQQIPISNVSGLANIINAGGGQQIIKTEPQTPQQIPALVPTSSYQNIPSLTPVMISSSQLQQQTIPALLSTNMNNVQNQQQKTTIIRPVQMANVQGHMLPQGLTLIQRPGQQPQLVQTIQQQPMQRTIITQQQDQHLRPQMRQQTIFVPQQQMQQTHQLQGSVNTSQQVKKGITVPDKCYLQAMEMFKNANVVSRVDKARILGFMTGLRDNAQPNADNTAVIKLSAVKEKVLQENGSYVLMSVESFVKLDYNTGEWKKFENRLIMEEHHEEPNSTKNSLVIN